MISNDSDFPLLDEMIAAAPEGLANVIPMSAAAEPAMSSLEIAKITGKRHDHVLRDIESILNEAGISAPKFGACYKGGNGKDLPCYLLPRRECDLVISGYSVKYRLAIIDRWQELEAKQSVAPVNLEDPACLRTLLLGYTEKVMALETTVSELTPKAEALARLSEAAGSMCITDAAKVLGKKAKELFSWLSSNGWIFRRGRGWVPYGTRVSQGVMEMKPFPYTDSQGVKTVAERALITTKGLARLAEQFSKAF